MFLDAVRCLFFVRYFQGIEMCHGNKKKQFDVKVVAVTFLQDLCFSVFTLWYLKNQTEQDTIIGRMQKKSLFHTPAEAFIDKLQRLCTLFAVYAQNISPTVYFAPISYFLGVWSSRRHEKRQQSWRKPFSLLLKSVEITAVNELNTNGVKSITVQRSKIA